MNICMDGLSVSKLKGTGLYSYTYELIMNLLRVYPQSKYDLIWDNSDIENCWRRNNNLSYIQLDLDRKDNDYSLLEDYLVNNRVHIYHSPNNGFSIPENKVSLYVATLHDLIPLENSSLIDEKYLRKWMVQLPRIIKNSDKIIVFSRYLKEDLKNYYAISDEKVEVIYPGCSEQFKPIPPIEYMKVVNLKYKVEGDYILYVGSIHKRKGIELLIRAFRRVLGKKHRLKLIIIGRKDGKRREYYEKLKKLTDDLGIGASVIFTGPVKYEDMPFLYNGAKCTINLTKQDEFPLASIESLACGIPSICMKSRSMLEILENRVGYVEEYDEIELSNMILKILFDEKYRLDIIQKGFEINKLYSWEESIRKLVRLYESIAI